MGLSVSGILLILVLTVTGGAIAFIGDRLGFKVGKKRLSLFGLRPRYTSILVAILTGMVITLGTVTFLSAISLEVRTALFGLEKLKTTLANQKSELLDKEKMLEQLTTSIMQTKEELAEIDLQRIAAVDELSQADAKLKKLNLDYDKVRKKLDDTEKHLEQKNIELEVAESRVDVLQEVEKRLTARIEETTKEKESTEETLGRLYGGYILFQAEEIIHNKVITGSAEEIVNQISSAIKIADNLAYQKGARSNNSTYKALNIIGNDLNSYQELARVASEYGKGVFRIVAWGNTVLGEPLACYYEYYPEKKLFSKGDLLAETVINSKLSSQDIFEEIANVMMNLSVSVKKRGMLVNENGKIVDVPVKVLQTAIDEATNNEKPVKIRVLAANDIINTEIPFSVILEVIPLP